MTFIIPAVIPVRKTMDITEKKTLFPKRKVVRYTFIDVTDTNAITKEHANNCIINTFSLPYSLILTIYPSNYSIS